MTNRGQADIERKLTQVTAVQIASVSLVILIVIVVAIVQDGQVRRLKRRVEAIETKLREPQSVAGVESSEPPAITPDAGAERGGSVADPDLPERIVALAETVDERFEIPDGSVASAVLAELGDVPMTAPTANSGAAGAPESPARLPLFASTDGVAPADVTTAVVKLNVALERYEPARRWLRLAEDYGADAVDAALLSAVISFREGHASVAYAALQAAPPSIHARPAAVLLQGQIETALGMEQAAEVTLKLALQFEAVAADAAALLLERTIQRGDLDRAEGLIERAEAVAPGRNDITRYRAMTLLGRGEYDKCIELASMLVVANDRDEVVLRVLGDAQLAAQKAEDAVNTFGRLVRLRPDDPAVHDRLGCALLARLDTAGAIEQFTLATELDPAMAGAWVHLGVAHADADDCEKAVVAFDKAIEVEEGNANAHFARAVCLARVGSDAEAQRALEHALSLDEHLLAQAQEVRAFERILASEGRNRNGRP